MGLTFKIVCFYMLKTVGTIGLFAIYITLIGCGTPGPLYIPEQRYPLPQENAQQAPSTNSDNQPTKE